MRLEEWTIESRDDHPEFDKIVSEHKLIDFEEFDKMYLSYEDRLPADVKNRVERIRANAQAVSITDDLVSTGALVPVIKAKNDLLALLVCHDNELTDEANREDYLQLTDKLYRAMKMWKCNFASRLSFDGYSTVNHRLFIYNNMIVGSWLDNVRDDSINANTVEYINTDLFNVFTFLKMAISVEQKIAK